jgi:hypothetical protein
MFPECSLTWPFSIRVEPLGMDRRYNRYFKFGGLEELGDKPLLLVEGGEGDSWRTVLTQSQLKDLHASLNPRGQRECGLEASLRRHLEAVQKDKDQASARGEAADEDADMEGGDLEQRSMVLTMAERTVEATTAAQTRIQEHKLIKVGEIFGHCMFPESSTSRTVEAWRPIGEQTLRIFLPCDQ